MWSRWLYVKYRRGLWSDVAGDVSVSPRALQGNRLRNIRSPAESVKSEAGLRILAIPCSGMVHFSGSLNSTCKPISLFRPPDQVC